MSYTPIAVTFGNVTSTGTLTAFTVPSDSPQLAAAGIVTARSVNRSWNLSASGDAFNTYQATLAFVATDLDPGADPNRFVMAVGAAGTWVLPTVLSRTGTSIQAVGLTGFGDLAVGEPAAPGLFTGIAIGTNGIPSLTFSGNPGQSYRIQAATNLNHPITWIDLATATPAADGVVHIDDTLAAGYPMRFYRSVTP